MSASEIREKLHDYINNTDEPLLTEIYKMIAEEDAPYYYSAEDIAMFYQRRTSYLNGEGKNYTIEESLNSIRR